MGSLTLAGIIGGAGEGLQRSAESDRLTRMQDDEQVHQLQVQRQRDKAARNMAQTRSDFEVGMADAQFRRDIGMADSKNKRDLAAADLFNEQQLGAAELRYGQDVSLQSGELRSLEARTDATNESKEFIAALGQFDRLYGSGSGRTRGKVGEWTVDLTSTLNDDGSFSRKAEATHPAGMAMELVGDRMVYTNDDALREKGLAEFADPQQQAYLENMLLSELKAGNDEGQEFLTEQKYWPLSYLWAKFERDNKEQLIDFWKFYKESGGGRVDLTGQRGVRSTRARLLDEEAGIIGAPVTAEEQAEALKGDVDLGTTVPVDQRLPEEEVTVPEAAVPAAPVEEVTVPEAAAPTGTPTLHPGGALARGAWDVLTSGGIAGGIARGQRAQQEQQ
jgi:hypothetical protein